MHLVSKNEMIRKSIFRVIASFMELLVSSKLAHSKFHGITLKRLAIIIAPLSIWIQVISYFPFLYSSVQCEQQNLFVKVFLLPDSK